VEGGPLETQLIDLVRDTRSKYLSALEDDLDTPKALASVFTLIAEGNRLIDLGASSSRGINSVLEFMKNDFDGIFAVLFPTSSLSLTDEESILLRAREEARLSKDWAKSDLLRKQLLASGVEVQDTPVGQKWRIKSRKGE
jgi:cysteinyl-tRNA synthetase